jgi:two-component system response regulator VanR
MQSEKSTDILVVDDEIEIADLIDVYLTTEGYRVHKFYNGSDALNCARTQKIDLALLDIMLPDTDGFELCRTLRAEGRLFPIIMLTAKVEATDKILGLTIGADDYITKPFHPLELMARIRTQLRRYTRYNQANGVNASSADTIHIRGLSISKDTHRCILYKEELSLTPIEFSILWYLCTHVGKVVSSEELFEAVWGERFLDSNNTVMTHIARLREKMHESRKNPKFIKTVWGVGYTIESDQ